MHMYRFGFKCAISKKEYFLLFGKLNTIIM